MNPIEFFTAPNGSDIIILQDGYYHTLTEKDTEIIQFLYEHIQELYPAAFKALHEQYGKSWNFKYLISRRFAKCNFSLCDEKNDIQADHSFRLELVRCPLRGECKHEGIICRPKLNTQLSARETEIVKLICRHFTDEQISEMLFLSFHTVGNHRKNILRKLSAHSKAEIVDFAHKNNLI